MEGSYVGRQSRRSLVQRDLSMPTDLRDPASGMTYFQAAQQVVRLVNADTPTAQVPRIPFWENLWPGGAGDGRTATQNVYQAYKLCAPDWTSALFDLDVACDPSCGRLGAYSIFNRQYSALSAWSSIGGGNYHAMQWTVRKRLSRGRQFDFNYTRAKSIDLGSVTQRFGSFSGFVVNSWNPSQRKGVSDFTMPGETGQRNGIRGDGYFNIDMGLAKTFHFTESHRVQFRWEVFNVPNAVRFDVNSLTLDLGNTGAFGKYSDVLNSPRQMQFRLRYEF